MAVDEDGTCKPVGHSESSARDLPWHKTQVLLIDAHISRGQQLRIFFAKRLYAPGCLIVSLVTAATSHPKIHFFSLLDHALCETASDQAERCAHRETLLPSSAFHHPGTMAKEALTLRAAERKTVLWIDPNLTEASPSMRHLLSSAQTLREHGWKIRGWGHACSRPSSEIEFLKLPSPWLPGPLRAIYLYSFRQVAKGALAFFHLVKGRPPAAILHSSYVTSPDITSIQFHVGEWMRISKDLGDMTLKEKLLLPLQLLIRRAERKTFSNPHISQFLPASHSIGDLLLRDGVPREKIHVLSNSYDSTRFNPEMRKTLRKPAREALNYHSEHVVFSFAGFGNFTRKGLWLAVDAIVDLAKRPGHENTRLLVIGGNEPTVHQAREKIKARHGQEALSLFQFTGITDQPEYYFAASDGFLFPSYFEACALVGIETSVMGIPLFVTPHHGHEMYLKPGENGELLEWDAKAIADTLEEHVSRGLDRYQRVTGEIHTREEYAAELTRRYEAFMNKQKIAPSGLTRMPQEQL